MKKKAEGFMICTIFDLQGFEDEILVNNIDKFSAQIKKCTYDLRVFGILRNVDW